MWKRTNRPGRRKLMLFPLMDMFFILLLFFLVTSGLKPNKIVKKGNLHAAPAARIAEAQILIQMTLDGKMLWLDNTVFRSGWRAEFPARFIAEISEDAVTGRLRNFLEIYRGCSGDEVLAVIRCPGSLDYSDLRRLERTLKTAADSLSRVIPWYCCSPDEAIPHPRKIEFSIVEGSLDDIATSNISVASGRTTIEW